MIENIGLAVCLLVIGMLGYLVSKWVDRFLDDIEKYNEDENQEEEK